MLKLVSKDSEPGAHTSGIVGSTLRKKAKGFAWEVPFLAEEVPDPLGSNLAEVELYKVL